VTKPGSAGLPFFGVQPEIVTNQGEPVPNGSGGLLVLEKPWPSMLRTIWGDDDRYQKQYWSEIPGSYFTGDGAYRDDEGYYRVVGRIDDVLNVSGHRIGTAEIESALVSHPAVAEAAAVGKPDELKGQALVVFVTLKPGNPVDDAMKKKLGEHVAQEIGKFARPDEVRFADSLPKTRSGKIMRRFLKDIAAGKDAAGDMSTLEDLNVLAKLRENDE
jgi:acetyl-CoA synthetase